MTPETKRNEAYAFVKGGLRDISITRSSITWGVPVPWDERHVFYVWYDALINYLSAIGYGRDDDEVATWWPVSNHLIGKEIIRFHCVWWPAMCMAAGLEPVHHVHVNGWLLVGGEKLGKTMAAEGAVKLTDIEPIGLTKEFGVDPLRYYLLRETALGNDGEFSLEGIAARYNTDLANNLGNLVARVAAVVTSKCAGIGPTPRAELGVEGRRARRDRLRGASVGPVRSPARARSNVRARERDERLPRGTRALEDVARSGGRCRDGRRSRGDTPGGDTYFARDARRRAGDLAPDRAVGGPDEETFADVAVWGRYPGGPVEKGEPLFPRIKSDE